VRLLHEAARQEQLAIEAFMSTVEVAGGWQAVVAAR
jgi:hypothetical protein